MDYYERMEQFQIGDQVVWDNSAHCRLVKAVWYGTGPFEVIAIKDSELGCTCRSKHPDGTNRPDLHDEDCQLLLHPRTLVIRNNTSTRLVETNAIFLRKYHGHPRL